MKMSNVFKKMERSFFCAIDRRGNLCFNLHQIIILKFCIAKPKGDFKWKSISERSCAAFARRTI